MAIITYTCDTCRRNVDLVQYKKGFTALRNCVITLNCKGVLSPIAAHPEYVKGKATPVVPNLIDWAPRAVLYTHNQTVPSTRWTIKHNLNNKPDIDVFVYDTSDNLTEITPSNIVYVNTNELIVTVPLKYKGMAQCTTKYSNNEKIHIAATENVYIPISSKNNLTFAISKQYINPVVTFELFTAIVNTTTDVSVPLTHNNSLLAWGDINSVYFNGKNYYVYTVDLPTIIPDNITSTYALTITKLSTNNILSSPINQHKGLIWILMANGTVYSDKILTSAIDVTKLTIDNNVTTNNITSINNNIITEIYPIIKVL